MPGSLVQVVLLVYECRAGFYRPTAQLPTGNYVCITHVDT